MQQSRTPRKKWLLAAVKLLIVAVVLLAVWDTLAKAFRDLDQYTWSLDPWWLLTAAVLYLVGLLPAGLFWHRVLLVLGQDARLGETLRAYYIGHLGKYVPGKAMVVVLRAGLIRSQRVNTATAAVSVFLETLTMMSVGAFLAAAVLAAAYRDQTLWLLGALGLMVLAGAPTLPPVFKRLVRLAGVAAADPATAKGLDRLGYGTLLLGWASMCLVWLILALSLWAVLQAVGAGAAAGIQHLHMHLGAVSLATVAGFLSLVPGGLFVRDAILAELMVHHGLAPTVAAVAAILLRLVWLLSELVISGILYSWGRRTSTPQSPDRRSRQETP